MFLKPAGTRVLLVYFTKCKTIDILIRLCYLVIRALNVKHDNRITNRKGKSVERQRHKTRGLRLKNYDSPVAEVVNVVL